ncbi:hypothetical protein DI272_42740 [Streptomyces sp. Act143]|uniref:pyridoxamine 5'-phosphate oxidase family protein n=1 Tax=Streptomyces sp. Act143 TaxID=2200760 RepID=UPI000D6728D6|nr:pyridoxamine 5'-phosphate oxidase family protein [Streptomyces sp. Act143]PWI20135.1 hypothetical protein DI272_42740 [Streptomyces sp. Act143]
MSTPPALLRMVELSGAEAMWLLEGGGLGRLVLVRRELTTVRPARHVWEYGRLIIRTPVPSRAATYQVDEIRAVPGTGWTVTVSGPAEVITDPHEAAHHQRALPGWTHGPHDTLLRLHPKAVAGFRLARAVG